MLMNQVGPTQRGSIRPILTIIYTSRPCQSTCHNIGLAYPTLNMWAQTDQLSVILG